MKINIKEPPDRLVCNIYNNYMNRKYDYDWTESNTRFEYFLEWFDDKVQDFYNFFNVLWFDKKEQKITIRIDNWDVWGADHTLALIIVPVLKLLKEKKQGSPFTDPEDAPEKLRPTKEETNKLEAGEVDDKHHERWDWILDEMIWAFEQESKDWEATFFEKEFDKEGYKAYAKKIENGRVLFAKYFNGLWD